MRLRSLLLAALLAAAAAPLAAQSADQLAIAGLDLIVAGRSDSAVALWTRTWTGPEDHAKIEQLRASFVQLPQVAGPVLGYEPIRSIAITPSLQRSYYLLRSARQPVYLLLVLYRARDSWTVQTLNWNTEADRVLPADLFGDQHPGRP